MARRGKKESNDDVLKTYFDEIRATPLLSFEEELELSRRIMQGDEEARQKLIKANLRLVVKIARSFASSDIPLMDLIQEGNLGLIRAAQKYDFKKNVRFSTYASWWIKQAISRALVNKRRSIRLPHRKEEALKKIQRAYNALSQELMREPTAEELAREVHMAPEEVDQILSLSNTMVSLDAEAGKDDTTSLLELYEDRTYCPDVEFLRNSVREDTLRFLEKLMERERKILMYRFEFFGGEKYTLKQIGDEMGLSPETVRQIELRALKKFKENAAELKEYMQFSYC
ncbi:MAG TPA: RNA polymerase sigma factor RpoD/SigA [Termitinemataceae bacterium]|nr:RNA polymerase sigma factor RpoD/SigA [Termitinemataceae bacterium]HOM24479.1 RNA polymerase sigma factor RpoD/SigA [Termitinemataceae bacterium]HPQ01566.1 RNA polymerase sigma factor RpoD/SigA [Termitinemataceae bacterium]